MITKRRVGRQVRAAAKALEPLSSTLGRRMRVGRRDKRRATVLHACAPRSGRPSRLDQLEDMRPDLEPITWPDLLRCDPPAILPGSIAALLVDHDRLVPVESNMCMPSRGTGVVETDGVVGPSTNRRLTRAQLRLADTRSVFLSPAPEQQPAHDEIFRHDERIGLCRCGRVSEEGIMLATNSSLPQRVSSV